MPVLRSCRAVPFRGWVALLIVCSGCAQLAAAVPLVAPDELAGLAPSVRFDIDREWQHGEEWSEATWFPSPQGEGGEFAALDFDDTGLSPVVRAQSPSTKLIPLATGDAPLENTSLLRWATGTKGRVRGDYLTDFNETDRIGVQALTQAWMGIGLDTELNYWQRPVAGVGREPLWTGDLNLTYNLHPHPRFKFRSGAGGAWTYEDGQAHAGYNVTHGLDVYLLWRAMFTAEADWGKIDDDSLFRYRVALGLTFKAAEFYSGYESYKLGSERLDGWVNGVAIWY